MLISLDRVNVSLGGALVLKNISWRLGKKENWLIIGPSGSGKSTFLRLIRGRVWPDPGSPGERRYCLAGGSWQSPIGLEQKLAFFSPELQQRYQVRNWRLSGREVVLTGRRDTDLLYQRVSRGDVADAEELMDRLSISELSEVPYSAMSQGELRRVLIARALMAQPSILILDECCAGLDSRTRRALLFWLNRMAGADQVQLVATSHRADEIIDAYTHLVILCQGIIEHQGALDALSCELQAWRAAQGGLEAHRNESDSTAILDRCRSASASVQSGRSRTPPEKRFPKTSRRSGRSGLFISLRRVDVYIDRNPLLHDLDLEIRPGQNWAIVGANGSGKSTLLRTIYGDLPCAFGGEIDRTREGRRLDVREARKSMNIVSALFQIAFLGAYSVREAVGSGLFSSVGLLWELSLQQQKRVEESLHVFGLADLADRECRTLSYGQLRKVLIARALVGRPLLLLLDEPLDGLDPTSRSTLLHTLEENSREHGTGLMMVSHHPEDFPRVMTHRLVMKDGRIDCQVRL